MFDLRLGLALKKSIQEIHALAYTEYRDWRTLYMIEPWGWMNEETNVARILTLLHNTHAKEPVEIKTFIRDIAGELLKRLEPMELDELSPEERKRKIYEAVKKDLQIK